MIDYSFHDGLKVLSSQDGGEVFRASKDELLQQAKDIDSTPPPEPEIHRIEVKNGKKININLYRKIGESATKSAILMFQPWGISNSKHGEEMSSLASGLDRSLVIVEQPGFSGSDLFPTSVVKDLAKTGSYAAAGEWLAPAINDFFESEDIIAQTAALYVHGASEGGRLALSAAPFLDQEQMIINAVDPPGSEYLGFERMAWRFTGLENGNVIQYTMATPEDITGIAKGNPLKVPIRMVAPPRQHAPSYLWQTLIDRPLSMSKAGLEKDLEAAAETDAVKGIQLIQLDESRLNNSNNMRAVADRVNEKNPGVIDLLEIPNHSHAVIGRQAFDLAMLFVALGKNGLQEAV
ncbi:hypothetical protein FWF48_02135 [Candidatus Saccharibacteria bacterium]|nr:hypothetical protein [Candidatus Saccharibacteria bacterium]